MYKCNKYKTFIVFIKSNINIILIILYSKFFIDGSLEPSNVINDSHKFNNKNRRMIYGEVTYNLLVVQFIGWCN